MIRQLNPDTSLELIHSLFEFSDQIRYVAIYANDKLVSQQRDAQDIEAPSSAESDTYEELLVNPTLLKLASQRGNIDCGGLDYLLIKYGSFFQLICAAPNGHISICLKGEADINQLPKQIFTHLNHRLW